MNFTLKLYSKVHRLAFDQYVKPEPFINQEPRTEMFPSLPLHSSSYNYKANKNATKYDDDDENCNKEYPMGPKMTSAESPQIFTKVLTRRLPKTVQSKRKVFLSGGATSLLSPV